MSAENDAERLAELLRMQREAGLEMAQTRNPEKRSQLIARVKQVRDECLVLVDEYFRQSLRPVLAARFPGKGLHAGEAMFRYTELVNDFFVQVLATFDDPFWQKDSAIELRNYASIVISNHGIRDALRRRKKQKPFPGDQAEESLEDRLAADVEQRFVAAGIVIDPTAILDVLEQWRKSSDQHLQALAMLMRHKYVSDMTMQQIAADLKVSVATAYRRHEEALQKLRVAIR